jgi:hypothetical protein
MQTNPETNELAIAKRLLGMADRIGHSAIPEEIANEARTALTELEQCAATELRSRAELVARWLIDFHTAGQDSAAQEHAARTLVTVTANLCGHVELEIQRTNGERAAA